MLAYFREMEPKRRVQTLLSWALLIASPFLLLCAISLFSGRNAFATYPVWSDELDYWRTLFSWDAMGFHTGYSGVLEAIPQYGTLGAHGITAIMLYGWFVKLFGLGYHTIVLCNAVWIALAGAVFCALRRPRPTVALCLAGFLTLYMPIVLYAASSMTELFNYAFMLLYLSFVFTYHEKRNPWMLLLCCLTMAVGCIYRISYFILFLPIVLVYCRFGFNKRLVLGGIGALLISLACYVLSSSITSPYTQGFLYQLMHAPDVSTFMQMLLSHTKSNLFDYLVPFMGTPMEHAFHWLYWGVLLMCLLGSFVRFARAEDGRLRLKGGLNKELLCCALLLMMAFGIIVVLYETNDWSDFRTLSPFLFLVVAYLAVRRRMAIPITALAGMLVTLVVMLSLPPTGMFADETHFEAFQRDPELSEIIQTYLEYDPDATDPFANTVRIDIVNMQTMEELHPGFGLQHGWFTTESVQKSRWLLTDHLKCVVYGYENIIYAPGCKVYKLVDSPQED